VRHRWNSSRRGCLFSSDWWGALPIESDFEIDKISDSRIEGRSLSAMSIDVKKCKAVKREWQSFTWIPK